MRMTRPPRASTVSRPTIASAAQSAPFDQNVGLDAADDVGGRVLVEDHDGVDAVERREHLGALVLRVDRPRGPLLPRTERRS